MDRSFKCVEQTRVTIGASIRRRRETNTCPSCHTSLTSFSLELKSRCSNNGLGSATNRRSPWHKRHDRLFIRCLLRNDSEQPTKRQPTEERCRERIVARTTATRCRGWTRFVEHSSQICITDKIFTKTSCRRFRDARFLLSVCIRRHSSAQPA